MRNKISLLVLSIVLATGSAAQSQPENGQQAPAREASAMNLESVTLLSDTQGVNFAPYLGSWKRATQATWERLSLQEAKASGLRNGNVTLRFKILPNGKIMDGSMILEGRSGSTSTDRAAWTSLTGSKYPSLPSQFQGPYLEMRTVFSYKQPPSS